MKRLFAILGLLFLALLSWYFLIKPSDYNIYFNVSTSSGHAYDELLTWDSVSDAAEETSISAQLPYRELVQQLSLDEKNYTIQWNLSRLNDSTTRVKAGISEPGNRIMNRLLIPFLNTDFENTTLNLVMDYKKFLEESISQFRIKVTGTETTPSKFCACTRAKTTPEKKAFKMMRDYSYLSGFIASNGLEPDGNPVVEILKFREEERIIEFDFCFPFVKQDSLPESPDIFFKQFEARPAIKAIYNGDYRFSNKSWYHIFDYAEDQDIPYLKQPLEVYYNNPNMGGNTLEWVTDIYLPIDPS